ncbi:MAG: CapA family protein [Bacteroidota bacterium]
MKVLFTGDLCFCGAFDQRLSQGKAVFGPKLQALLKQQDAIIGNWEGPLWSEEMGLPAPKIWQREAALVYLQQQGFTHLNLANNHSFDLGEKHFFQNQRKIAAAGIESFGAGKDLASAMQPAIIPLQTGRLLVFGASFQESPPATSRSAGVFYPGRGTAFLRDIRPQLQQGDQAIFCYHGEEEYTTQPLPARRKWLHQLAKSGLFSAIICHHPHVLQGRETIAGVPIYYSLGNTVFDVPGHHHRSFTDLGALVEVTITAEAVAHEWQVIRLDREIGMVTCLPGTEIAEHVASLNRFDRPSHRWRAEAWRVFQEERMPTPAKKTGENDGKAPAKDSHARWQKLFRVSFYRSLFATLRYRNSRSILFSALRHWGAQRLGRNREAPPIE